MGVYIFVVQKEVVWSNSGISGIPFRTLWFVYRGYRGCGGYDWGLGDNLGNNSFSSFKGPPFFCRQPWRRCHLYSLLRADLPKLWTDSFQSSSLCPFVVLLVPPPLSLLFVRNVGKAVQRRRRTKHSSQPKCRGIKGEGTSGLQKTLTHTHSSLSSPRSQLQPCQKS